jgi:hypothetical protein
MKLLGGSPARTAHDVTTDAMNDASAIDAFVADAETADAIVAVTPVDAGTIDARPDARGGHVVRLDGGDGRVALLDAAPPVPVDAAPLPQIDAAVEPQFGFIVVKNDLPWCDVKINGVLRGRNNDKIQVEAGKHTVVCDQTGIDGNVWKREVDVKGGKVTTVEGSMRGVISIRFDVDATVDGKAYAKGTVVSIKAGRLEVSAGGSKGYLTLSVPCTIRTTPELGCY